MNFTNWVKELSSGFASTMSFSQLLIKLLMSPVFLVLVIAALVFALVYIYRTMKEREKYINELQKKHRVQLRSIQLGFNSYQSKIYQELLGILKLEDPLELAGDPLLFEESAQKLLNRISELNEGVEPLDLMCKNLVITYEKLYHGSGTRTPLKNIRDVENNALIFLTDNMRSFIIGKIIGRGQEHLAVRPIAGTRDVSPVSPDTVLNGYIYRAGDAEYTFVTTVATSEETKLRIRVPGTFEVEAEAHHPFIEANIPCEIAVDRPAEEAGHEEIPPGLIFRLNDKELVMRATVKMDFNRNYGISFTISDFLIRIEGRVVREKYIKNTHVYYYNVVFISMTDVARKILKDYILEHI